MTIADCALSAGGWLRSCRETRVTPWEFRELARCLMFRAIDHAAHVLGLSTLHVDSAVTGMAGGMWACPSCVAWFVQATAEERAAQNAAWDRPKICLLPSLALAFASERGLAVEQLAVPHRHIDDRYHGPMVAIPYWPPNG